MNGVLSPPVPRGLSLVLLAVPTEEAGHSRLLEQLAAEERSLLGPRAVPKRRYEHVAGRVAARWAVTAAVEQMGWGSAEPFLILRQEDGPHRGRPVIMSGDPALGPPFDVSISHADGLAVAAAGSRRLGVDLVTVEPHREVFIADTFHADELDAWGRHLGVAPTSDESVCMAFCAKEAALKWIGTGMGLPLRAVSTLPAVATTGAAVLAGLAGSLGALSVRVSASTESAARVDVLGMWWARRDAQRILVVWS